MISGGSVQPGYPPANAFDDNTASVVSIVSSASTYVGQDFGAPGKDIRWVRLLRGTAGSYGFSARLQYSDDAVSWLNTNLAVNLPAGDAAWHGFELGEYGRHRYWRFLDTGSAYYQIQEIEMYETNLCADELHAASIIIVAHDHDFAASDFADMHTANITAKLLKLTTDSIDWDRAARARYPVPGLSGWAARWLGYQAEVQAIADNPANNVMIIRSVADIYTAKAQGKAGAILGSEGAMQLEGDLTRVQQYYDLGWRETQISWSGTPNQLTDGAHLTTFGQQVIGEMNRLGILMDVSHHGGTLMAEELASTHGPVIRSHDTPNALGWGGESTDDMILTIANSGGGYGVYALHFYSSYYGGAPSLSRLLTAIDYVVNLAGIDHVAIGADYFPENGAWVFPNLTYLPELTRALLEHGYSYEAVQKILGLNMIRLYQHAWLPNR